jgi:hypothetical protein
VNDCWAPRATDVAHDGLIAMRRRFRSSGLGCWCPFDLAAEGLPALPRPGDARETRPGGRNNTRASHDPHSTFRSRCSVAPPPRTGPRCVRVVEATGRGGPRRYWCCSRQSHWHEARVAASGPGCRCRGGLSCPGLTAPSGPDIPRSGVRSCGADEPISPRSDLVRGNLALYAPHCEASCGVASGRGARRRRRCARRVRRRPDAAL